MGLVFLVNLLGIMPLNFKSIGQLALCFSAIASAGAQVIPAPFGLKWGDTSAPILSFAEHTGSKIETQSGSSGRETIEVRGPFSNQRYQRLGFTFQADRLVQVAAYYQAPDESNEARELLAALRGEIEQSFGSGELLETGSEKNVDGYLETRRVFRWERNGCAIWLISMQVKTAKDLGPPRGEISVVYANLGLSRQIEIDGQARSQK
ncbi:MAG TPA: hypothetical protein VIH54_19890 [Chthoniobacterales bacterium]